MTPYLNVYFRMERLDSDFEPDPTEENYDNINIVIPVEKPIESDRTFLVYESSLMKLIRYCPNCGAVIDTELTTEKQNTGSQLKLSLHCLNGCNISWSSQPEFSATRGVGSVLITAAAEMSGILFSKLKRFAWLLNLKFFEKTTYYRLRADYVFPQINLSYKDAQAGIINEIKEEKRKIDIGMDGQCDTPGHNASYCTVTAMDADTNKVIDFKVVRVAEVKNSQNMEKEGTIRCLNAIQDEHNLEIRVLSTDRHPSIRKLLRTDPRFLAIIHQFDIWHIAKSLLKALSKAAKKKGKRKSSSVREQLLSCS